MVNMRLVTSAIVLASAFAGTASAQFDDYQWTLVQIKGGGASLTADTMHFDCDSLQSECELRYETTAPAAGVFHFQLNANSTISAGIGAFTYINGTQVGICKSCITEGTLTVEAGDTFGFGLQGFDTVFADINFTDLTFVPAPIIDNVDTTLAFDGGPLVIRGSGFLPTTTVEIDGVDEPVVAQSPTELTIAPAARAPGFADVTVTNDGSSALLSDGIAFLPTLDASTTPAIDKLLRVQLHAGHTGLYTLFLGLTELPLPLSVGSNYGALAVDPAGIFVILETSVAASTGPILRSFAVPDVTALAGLPVFVQALTEQDGTAGVTASFTNPVTRVLNYATTTTLNEWAPATTLSEFGKDIASVDDIDGDGVPEIAVSAPDGPGAVADAGYVQLFSGALGTELLLLEGQTADGRFGDAIAGAGDLDGDGRGDILVTEPGTENVYAISGASGAVLFTLPAPSTDVASVGDLDNDGVSDIVIGFGQVFASEASVFSGIDGAFIREHTAPTIDALGASVSGAGDVDADGTPDYILGAPRSGGGLGTLSYAVVHSGADGAVLHTFTGPSLDDFGVAVGGAGDINGDGHSDVIVSATGSSHPAFESVPGYVHVMSGADGSLLHEFVGNAPSVNSNGVIFREFFGSGVDSAGDVNGDGVPDIAVGVPLANGTPGTTNGALHIYSGAFGTLIYALEGPTIGSFFGNAVAGLGDLNGDGLGDFGAGARFALGDGMTVGAAVVYSGVPLD